MDVSDELLHYGGTSGQTERFGRVLDLGELGGSMSIAT